MRFVDLRVVLANLILSVASMAAPAAGQDLVPDKAEGVLRIATFNVSLNRPLAGQLAEDLKKGDRQARAAAAVVRLVRPDVLLLNELDYSSESDNARLFAEEYLDASGADELGSGPWTMPFHFSAPVNTGEPSGMDLNRNDKTTDPEDAWGYGRFPGQYGMAVLSRLPIRQSKVRTLQKFLWSELPSALRPQAGGERPYYDDLTWSRLRLSSKSFWDVPVEIPGGLLHVLASHPTPPAFDGPEDRNGCRNHDEIKLIQFYIEGAEFLRDDLGKPAGLKAEDQFVILGDLNSDPHDGGSRPEAIIDLLRHPRVAPMTPPASAGAAVAARSQAGANRQHVGNPIYDTGDFSDRAVGNLRVDYAVPSSNFEVVASGVFWPDLTEVPEENRQAIQECLDASDHHLVWIDIRSR